MRVGFAEGVTSFDALNGWVEPQSVKRVPDVFPPRGRDEQLGAIFRQMRAVVGLNEAMLARKLGTDVSVIMDLEAGIADGLPPWRELAAIVERYAFVAGVDPSPILTRLMQVSSAATANEGFLVSRPPLDAAPPPPPRAGALPAHLAVIRPVTAPMLAPASPRAIATDVARVETSTTVSPDITVRQRNKDVGGGRTAIAIPATKHSKTLQSQPFIDAEAVKAPRISRPGKIGRVAGPVVLLGLVIGGYFAVQNLPRFAYGAVAFFPRRLHDSVRNVIDLAVFHTAAVKDDLRWIDVGDPRLRKGDRLKSR